MGLEQQQKCISVTEFQYHAGVRTWGPDHVSIGLAQAVRRHIAHHKLRLTCKSKINTGIPLGAVEEF